MKTVAHLRPRGLPNDGEVLGQSFEEDGEPVFDQDVMPSPHPSRYTRKRKGRAAWCLMGWEVYRRHMCSGDLQDQAVKRR